MSVQQFVHIATTNAEGKWKSIALSNLAATFNRSECYEALAQALPILLKDVTDRLDHLVSLNAPECIVSNQRKIVDRANKGKHPAVAALYTQLNKIDAAKAVISAQ